MDVGQWASFDHDGQAMIAKIIIRLNDNELQTEPTCIVA